MDSFTDIKIIEANRLHSEEAKSGNNENYSLWTNNLQDILLLEPKDEVSVYGAFISERGAGQSSSIEIKGVELGDTHTFQVTNISKSLVAGDRYDDDLPSRASIIDADYQQKTVKIKDNQLNFTINYFVPANALNSYHLPRRWTYNYPTIPRKNFTERDNRTNQGASLIEFKKSNYSLTNLLYQSPAFYQALTNSGDSPLMKPLNDNSRYTLMIRDITYFTENSVINGDLEDFDMRDPENSIYRTYSELKEINIPAGFNSPEFIATEFSRQLQNIFNDEILIQNNSGSDKYPQPVSKLLESETYKAFYVGNIEDNTKANFLKYFNLVGSGDSASDKAYGTSENASGFEYLRQYHIIACKYPELYEKGRLINIDDDGDYTGIRGAEVFSQINFSTVTENEPLILAIDYNKDNCDLFKAFFDAQKLYPEIIENLNDRNSGYNTGNSIDNTRWIHINRWEEDKQSLKNPTSFETTQLGWGGYYYPRSYQPASTAQLMSLLLPLYFDKEQENIFYDEPQIGKNEFTYGCLGKVYIEGRILIGIYPFKHEANGLGSPPLEELRLTPNTQAGQINAGRRIGFDLHFNAPGMYYILPQSGWSNAPDFKSSYSAFISVFDIQDDEENTGPTLGEYKMEPWKKLLYIGADNPKLNWDGTNFNFSDFHTSMNRGDKQDAGKPYLDPTTDPDVNAGDTVYKINPPDLYNDWTPDRCPYSFDDYNLTVTKNLVASGGTLRTMKVKRTNQNYKPFQIYDQLCGIFVDDFGVSDELWTSSLWGLLGFTYKQFHGTNNRQVRIQKGNSNNLTLMTTNAEIIEGDTKIFSTNWASTPLYNNMINTPVSVKGYDSATGATLISYNKTFPTIVHKTGSISIIADNLPTRMIRGYYTIRSNILEGTPFIGGKVNNTTMPIIGIVDKINGDGDFYFGQESSLNFTITKPIRLASISISIHDPDGSYARTSEQSTILFKVTKPKIATFNIAEQLFEENKNNPILQRLNNPSL